MSLLQSTVVAITKAKTNTDNTAGGKDPNLKLKQALIDLTLEIILPCLLDLCCRGSYSYYYFLAKN